MAAFPDRVTKIDVARIAQGTGCGTCDAADGSARTRIADGGTDEGTGAGADEPAGGCAVTRCGTASGQDQQRSCGQKNCMFHVDTCS